MDPAFADLKGDGGAELLSDLRATSIGSLAHVLRLRLSVIAECPSVVLEAVDRFVQATVRCQPTSQGGCCRLTRCGLWRRAEKEARTQEEISTCRLVEPVPQCSSTSSNESSAEQGS